MGKIQKSNFANSYLRIIDQKYTGINPIKKWLSNYRFRKECKKIFDRSPNFTQLWEFADFIRLSEHIFFYNNKNGATLYSSRSFKFGENGFVIVSNPDNVQITLKLYSEDQKIVMDIKRLNGTNLLNTITFVNNDWEETPDDKDIILLDNVIGIMNRHIIMLLKYCYDRRGSYDYEKTIPETDKQF